MFVNHAIVLAYSQSWAFCIDSVVYHFVRMLSNELSDKASQIWYLSGKVFLCTVRPVIFGGFSRPLTWVSPQWTQHPPQVSCTLVSFLWNCRLDRDCHLMPGDIANPPTVDHLLTDMVGRRPPTRLTIQPVLRQSKVVILGQRGKVVPRQ